MPLPWNLEYLGLWIVIEKRGVSLHVAERRKEEKRESKTKSDHVTPHRPKSMQSQCRKSRTCSQKTSHPQRRERDIDKSPESKASSRLSTRTKQPNRVILLSKPLDEPSGIDPHTAESHGISAFIIRSARMTSSSTSDMFEGRGDPGLAVGHVTLRPPRLRLGFPRPAKRMISPYSRWSSAQI